MKNLKPFVQVLLAGLAFAAMSSVSAAAKPAEGKQSGFVKVRNWQFELDGKPYYFAGTNLWYGMYLGSPGETGDRARLLRELDDLAALNVKNLRVLAISESSTLKRAVRPAVLQTPQEVDETLWKGLDFLLAEMAKRDMKAVLYLNNFWQWSGGMSQYVAWFSGKPVVDPDVTGDWNAFMDNSAAFYREPKAQEAWRATIKLLVRRKNSINGRRYDNDPTIMSWQLANEPRPGSDANSKPHYDVFVKWTDETAGYLKKLAPKQLISTGNEGWMGTGGSRELFQRAHQTRNVDYLTFHMWAPNWSWFDPKNAEATYQPAMAKINDYLEWHTDVARSMGKPIVLEEFGINRDNGSFSPEATTAYRDRIYTEVYRFIERHVVAGSAFAGSNFWAWGGEGRTSNADFMWKAGDGFVGDPPQEPQGLYCIFDSDATTLAVIKEHARRIRSMTPRPPILIAPDSRGGAN